MSTRNPIPDLLAWSGTGKSLTKHASNSKNQLAIASSIALLLACGVSRNNETIIIRDILSRKAGFELKDSITILSMNDGGFDLQGTLANEYELSVSEVDFQNVMNHVRGDTVRIWIETDRGDYVTVVDRTNHRDTSFIVGVSRSGSIINLSLVDM